MMTNAEAARLQEARTVGTPWRKWGPYLSERQWGTVREDYSHDGDPWNYFTHDQARSRAYRWGEDGLAGISDDKQLLCFGIALWNGQDPILKERLFGLTNTEGNHGEDVKEYYFYLDNTPTHSYMKYLYKYPQARFPYDDLVRANGLRNRHNMEYELLDTGIFDTDRYFDVFVEYIKNTPEDILIQISMCNRGSEEAALYVLPTLWFRNTWSWPASGSAKPDSSAKPNLRQLAGLSEFRAIAVSHSILGERFLYCEGAPPLLFTENETNNLRIFGTANNSPFVKDGINDYIVQRQKQAVNPQQQGTKASAHYHVIVPPGAATTIWLRLSDRPPANLAGPFGKSFSEIIGKRRKEADQFYSAITPDWVSEDASRVMRQALAGMLWSKQYFSLDVQRWLAEHDADPMRPGTRQIRNKEWFHMVNDNVVSMPDKWEYPWYAAWDQAFHAIALAGVDIDFAKDQLDLLLREFFLHPTGQMPACEWNFSDANPPVHAWATIFLFRTEQALSGRGDLQFLKRAFPKLMLNFSWWINRKDRFGKNLFEGGFLGLDNIGIFDRSAPLPGGGHLEQADATAWMALFCQNMMEIAIELACCESGYDDTVTKFIDHFFWIARAINQIGPGGMWDEEDGFYYDVLRSPDGNSTRLKVRSIVGLLPMCATTVIEPWQRERVPGAMATCIERIHRMPALFDSVHPTGPGYRGVGDRGIFALVKPDRLRRMLSRMLDEREFLSPYGIRALSRYHAEHPHTCAAGGREYRVEYQPAESDSAMFGGNSNWRGPVWIPLNAILIRALVSFYLYYGDSFKVSCPTGSSHSMNLFEVAKEITNRLIRIFIRDESGRRPVFGGAQKFQNDPLWRDNILFYEYFHGDNGAGLGASHQTGWTGLIAQLIEFFGRVDGAELLAAGKTGAFARESQQPVPGLTPPRTGT
jgi:hypothetical protein